MTDKKWWDASLEPKRSFRWEIEYTKGEDVYVLDSPIRIPSHYITSVKMPSFSFQKEEQDQIGAKRVIIDPHPTFSPVEITFIDDQESTIYNWIYWYFYNAGVKLDGSGVTTSYGLYNYKGFYSFSKAANFFGSFKIYTLAAANGAKLKETIGKGIGTEFARLGNASIPPVETPIKFIRQDVLSREASSGAVTYKYKSPASGSGVYTDSALKDRKKAISRNFVSQNTNNEINQYRIDEIELVKPYIVDFKQSDLNYSESGFITYTITINYATYKYSKYGQDRVLYNSLLGHKYGQPPSTGRTRTPTAPRNQRQSSSEEDA